MAAMHGVLPADLAAAFAARPELAGAEVLYFPELASTNDTAAALAESGAADGTTVIADRQNAGRGRHGRVWDSPPGVGLYASVVLRGSQSPVVTLLAGVAVAEAVQGVARAAVELKWPNDVVAPHAGAPTRRKLAGILTEALPGAAGRDAAAVLGISVRSLQYKLKQYKLT